MARVLIVFNTRTGNTEAIASLIAEGVRFAGCEAKVIDTGKVTKEGELEDCDGLILGAPTYHGEMTRAMKNLLFLGEKADLAGKAGGSFGAYGWSGEALGRIHETMRNIYKMNMMAEPLRLKDASLGGAMKMAQDYGRGVAEKALAGCEGQK